MGNVNCHCLNAKSEAGPILDLAFKTEPSPRRHKAQGKASPSKSLSPSETHLSKALNVYLARRSLAALRLLPLLESKAGMRLSQQAKTQYNRLGPRFTGSLYEVHRMSDGSAFLGHIREEKPSGPGCLFHIDGSMIEGSWGKEGLEGGVRVIYMNGEYFEVSGR